MVSTISFQVEYTEAIIAKAFDQYGCGFLLVFGTFGNIVSLVVLRYEFFTMPNITIRKIQKHIHTEMHAQMNRI